MKIQYLKIKQELKKKLKKDLQMIQLEVIFIKNSLPSIVGLENKILAFLFSKIKLNRILNI